MLSTLPNFPERGRFRKAVEPADREPLQCRKPLAPERGPRTPDWEPHAPSRHLRALALAATSALAGPALAQTLTMGVRAGPESIDPHFTASGTHAEALKHVFDTLTWSGDQLQIEPGLAESWRPVDPTTWEFKLRSGVKFHDGSDFTAEDVKFSIERIPTVSGPNPTTIYVRRVKETKIVDPHTVHIVTDGPAPTLPNDFIRLFIVSAKAAAGLTKDNANEAFNTGRAAIGTGPFRFVSWTPKDQMVVERSDGYWRGPAPWQRVVRKEIPNDAARVAQLRAGQLDMIVRAPAADIPTLERDAQAQRGQGRHGVRVLRRDRHAGEAAAGLDQGRLAARLEPVPRPARCGKPSTSRSTARRWPRSPWRASASR